MAVADAPAVLGLGTEEVSSSAGALVLVCAVLSSLGMKPKTAALTKTNAPSPIHVRRPQGMGEPAVQGFSTQR